MQLVTLFSWSLVPKLRHATRPSLWWWLSICFLGTTANIDRSLVRSSAFLFSLKLYERLVFKLVDVHKLLKSYDASASLTCVHVWEYWLCLGVPVIVWKFRKPNGLCLLCTLEFMRCRLPYWVTILDLRVLPPWLLCVKFYIYIYIYIYILGG